MCPPRHPLLKTSVFSITYPFRPLDSGRSIIRALEAASPDLVVPCDELAAHYLRSHYDSLPADSGASILRDLVTKSLGAPQYFSAVSSRKALLDVAKEEGIAVPETALVSSEEQVERWLAAHKFPAVLKADGTSGGEGVQIVSTREEAIRAFRQLQSPVSFPVVLKRSLVDHDHNSVRPWLTRERRNVSIQPVVCGREANTAFFAWKGEVLASIGAEVLSVTADKGPAAFIRLSRDSALLGATERLVRRLGLSGFGGLDFIVEQRTEVPYLIELNARLTQTCHLAPSREQDLPGAAYFALTGNWPAKAVRPIVEPTLALFPAAWRSRSSKELFRSAYKDLPSQEPALIETGLKPESRINRENWAALKARLRQPWRTQKHEA